MITGRQICAARALLRWDAEDLATKAGLSRETVSNIETEKVQPHEKTVAKIIRTFDQHGVELLEDEGVKIRKHQIRVFTGKSDYKQFLDHIYFTMKDFGGRIRQFNISDGKTLPYAEDYASLHLERMGKILGIDARALVVEGDYNFSAPYCTYRWLREENKILIPYYVYGDYLAQVVSASDRSIEVISIHSKLLVERYVEQFDLFWDTALVPDKNTDA